MRGITPLCGTTNETHMREALAVKDLKVDVEMPEFKTVTEMLDQTRYA
jgi:hypothetical protein